MCGIVGYVGQNGSLSVLVDSLKRLEYRGYDSAGVAFQNGKGIEVYKRKGKINDLLMILPGPLTNITAGLGHTRWATHGMPSTENAHPHGDEGVFVVHNGIIENYRELRSRLQSGNKVFTSDTDTEVIPRLILSHLENGNSLKEAINRTVSDLTGTFAIGIISDREPDTVFAVRKGSPLVIGIGEREYFLASDIPALLPYTNKFIFMEDGELYVLRADGIQSWHLNSDEVNPDGQRIVTVDWTPSMAEKEGYEHFMLKEIYEQPGVIMHTLSEWIDNPLKLLDELGISTRLTMGLNRLHIVACGTSYHAALVGRYMIERLSHIPVYVDIASEYRYKELIMESNTLFISITQSGETADTLAAQREARKRGLKTLTICNVVGSSSSREADAVLYTRAGPEIGVASTKAFTSQLAAICLLAIGLGIKRGRLSTKEADTVLALLLKLPSVLKKVLAKDEKVREIARTIAYAKDVFYLGRGINYPVALEGALKLKEISYIHAEGYPAGEMKHGPIALIEEGFPVLVVAPVDDMYVKTLSNIEEVKARGGRVIAVTDEPEYLGDKVDDLIDMPATHPALSPFISIVPLQLLAYHTAKLRGCDIDQPRNLAKSVTVE